MSDLAYDREAFELLCKKAGALQNLGKITPEQWGMVLVAVDLCAGIGDDYERNGSNCGDEIRAAFGVS